MARRTKREMEKMNNFCRLYLLSNKLDPHAAYEEMVKEHLGSGQMIPYYIKGIKDFINVSQELAAELNYKERMKKKDQERQSEKETIINYIMNISKEDINKIWKEYNKKVTHSEKLNIVDVHMCIHTDDMKESYIDQSTINTFTKIYNDQLQPV